MQYLENHVGQINGIEWDKEGPNFERRKYFSVEFPDVFYYGTNSVYVLKNQILYFSENKEDVEIFFNYIMKYFIIFSFLRRESPSLLVGA